ncbi:MAG: hypothetical protein ACSHX6_15725 [Akkermansiaceae bacterium]
MSISSIIKDSFKRSFTLYSDLVDTIDNASLNSQLPQIRSNSIGQQLWCVVGARESFSNAIKEGKWTGFSCSLESTSDKIPVAEALNRSSKAVQEALENIESYTDTQNRLIIDLLEHEAAHHGQLIRFLYGLNLEIPARWKTKYSL